MQTAFFGALPGVMRAVVAPMAPKQVRQAYYSQGLGRHSLAEQRYFASRDLQAVSDVVKDSAFITGARLTVFDFAVAAQLASLLDHQPATWATTLADERPVLRDYAERIQKTVDVYARQRVG